MCSACARRACAHSLYRHPFFSHQLNRFNASDRYESYGRYTRYTRYIRYIRYTSPAGDRERVGGTRGAEAQGVLKSGEHYDQEWVAPFTPRADA